MLLTPHHSIDAATFVLMLLIIPVATGASALVLLIYLVTIAVVIVTIMCARKRTPVNPLPQNIEPYCFQTWCISACPMIGEELILVNIIYSSTLLIIDVESIKLHFFKKCFAENLLARWILAVKLEHATGRLK